MAFTFNGQPTEIQVSGIVSSTQTSLYKLSDVTLITGFIEGTSASTTEVQISDKKDFKTIEYYDPSSPIIRFYLYTQGTSSNSSVLKIYKNNILIDTLTRNVPTTASAKNTDIIINKNDIIHITGQRTGGTGTISYSIDIKGGIETQAVPFIIESV